MKKTYIEPVVAMSELENENIIASSEVIRGGETAPEPGGEADSRIEDGEFGLNLNW